MDMPHDHTTPIQSPTLRAGTTGSLVPTPRQDRRRLTLGSSRPGTGTGYGIVSASGFSAWRREAKRGSTSTGTGTGTGTSATLNGNSTGAARRGRKGLGMGLQGTPARKKFKRDSRKGKVSNLSVLHFD
jgi:hypothetical protein